jgi:hypothetical protein
LGIEIKSLSLSKALGCKRVHDGRIAGVTFEENASRNALIVNKEYAWVGNPFPAHEVLFEGPFLLGKIT